MKYICFELLLIALILLTISCAAPRPKACPREKIIYERFDTRVTSVAIYNQIQATHKF